jgi:hypothetical protein
MVVFASVTIRLRAASGHRAIPATKTGRLVRRLRGCKNVMDKPPVDPFHYDGIGRKIDWGRLVQDASLDEVSDYLGSFGSYARTEPMSLLMRCSRARRCVKIFLEWGNMCDAPWPHRS